MGYKNNYGNSLGYIGSRLKNVDVLTKREVAELIKKYREGDEEAGKKIVLHNIKFVLSVAKFYIEYRNFEYDDVIGYGVLGLYRAINRFKPELGFTFSTYSRMWIIQSINRNCVEKRNLVNKYNCKDSFTFKSIDDSEWHNSESITAIEETPREVFMESIFEKYLNKIPEREQIIFKLRFGFDPDLGTMTLRDIGSVVNLSGEMVRQILEQRMRKMKRNKKIRKLVGK